MTKRDEPEMTICGLCGESLDYHDSRFAKCEVCGTMHELKNVEQVILPYKIVHQNNPGRHLFFPGFLTAEPIF